MFCKQYGNGENVMIGIHGWSGDHRTFEPLMPYLAPHYTFYSVDLPGVGRSVTPLKWDMDHVCALFADGLQKLKCERITLFGSCSGGLVGLFIAKYLQDTRSDIKVDRICLIDPFAYFPWYFDVFVAPQVGKYGWFAYCSTFANPLGRWLTNLSLRSKKATDIDLTESFKASDHRVTYQYLKLLRISGDARQFAVLQMPVDIILGGKTFQAVRKSVPIWQSIFSQSAVTEIKNSGHLPIEEAPKELAAMLFR